MRENNSPSEQPGPAIPPVPPAASTSDASAGDPYLAGDAPAGHVPPLSNGKGAGQEPDGRWRRRVLWLCLGLALAAIGVTVIKMARMLQDERTLQNVARVAVMQPAVPEIAQAGTPTTTPPGLAGAMPFPGAAPQPAGPVAGSAAPPPATADRDARDIAAVPPRPSAPGAQLAAPARGQDKVSPIEAASAAKEGSAGVAEAREQARGKADDQLGMANNGDGDVRERPRSASAARKAARERKKAAAAARAASREEMSRRGIAVRDTARDSDTFRRCPALGRKGAVTCRIHVCNGGAGKERACRPYLERRP